MLKRINLLLSFLLLSSSVALAAPKIATIDISKVGKAYKLNQADVAVYAAAKNKLMADPRKMALDELSKKLQALQAKLADVQDDLDERTRIVQEGQAASAAWQDLKNKWIQFQAAESREYTEALIDATTIRNKEILRVARSIGEAKGFDWILETSGKTNSKMPALLYVRNSTDITDLVIEEINKATPAAE